MHTADESESSVETLASLTARAALQRSWMPSCLSAVKSSGKAVCLPNEIERGRGEMWPPGALTDMLSSKLNIFPTRGKKTVDSGSVSFSVDLLRSPAFGCATGSVTAEPLLAPWSSQ